MRQYCILLLVLFPLNIFAQIAGFVVESIDTIGSYNIIQALVARDSNHVYATGMRSNSQLQYTRTLLAEMDDVGQVIWQKNIAIPPMVAHNIFDLEYSGKYLYLAGSHALLFGPSYGIVTQTDTAGNVRWMRLVKPNSENADISDVAITSDQGCVVTGSSTDTLMISKFFIARLDSSGNLLWSHVMEAPGYDFAFLNDVKVLANGDILTVGECFTSNVSVVTEPFGVIMRFDSNGNLLWSKKYVSTSSVKFNNMELSGSDVYIGGSSEFFDTLNAEFYTSPAIYRIGQNGHVKWGRNYLFSDHYYGSSIDFKQLPNTDLVMCAQISDATPNTPSKQMLLGFDSAGYCQNYYLVPPDHLLTALLAKSDNSFYFGGYYEQNAFLTQYILGKQPANWTPICYFQPQVPPQSSNIELLDSTLVLVFDSGFVSTYTGTAVNDLSAINRCDAFVGIMEQEESGFTLAPNPAHDELQLTFPTTQHPTTLQLFDVQGRMIQSENIASGTSAVKIRRNGMPAGLYLVRLLDNKQNKTLRFIFTD